MDGPKSDKLKARGLSRLDELVLVSLRSRGGRRAARGTGDADTGTRTGGEPELDRARERSTFYKSIARGILKIRPYL